MVISEKILSAGVVVLRYEHGEPRYLLLRAYNYWDFPKGEAGADEQPLDAAMREVEEETSLRDLELTWGEQYQETPPYGRGKVARYYIAQSTGGEVVLSVNPALGRAEHHEYRWLAWASARALLGERVRDILDWAHGIAGSTDPG